MSDSTSLRILIVDDHPMIRAGLRSQLEGTDDLTVVGEAGSVREAVERLDGGEVDVALVDHQLPDGYGLELLRGRAHCRDVAVVLVSGHIDQGLATQYLRAGARGYVDKSASAVRMRSVVHAAGRGENVHDTDSVDAAMARGSAGAQPLSAREVEVIRHVSKGATNDAIASRLNMSPHTVKTHLGRIYSKLGVTDRAQAVHILTQRGELS